MKGQDKLLVKALFSTLEYFNAFGENDTNEGKGGRHSLGSFLKQSHADAAARGKGVFGCDGTVEHVRHDVVLYEDPSTGRTIVRRLAEEINVKFVDEDPAIERALTKLTDEDIKALGALGLKVK